MISPIYLHPLLYESAIRLLYGSRYKERLDALAAKIEEGASVLDLCAGDAAVYRYALKDKNVRYTACDSNPAFLHWLERRGINTCRTDLPADDLPRADYVIMMISLYQFIPNERAVVEKMTAAADRAVIISEPVRNWAQSGNGLVRWAGKTVTRIGSANNSERFNEERLLALLKPLGFQTFEKIAGDREIVACYQK